MPDLSENNSFLFELKENKYLLAGSILLILPLVYFFAHFGGVSRESLFLLALPLMGIIIFKFELAYSLTIISLFINQGVSYFAISEIVALGAIASFFLTYKFKWSEVKNDLHIPYLIFIVSIIPSYFNSLELIGNKIVSLHLVLFFFLITFMPLAIKNYKNLGLYINVFEAVAVINGLYLIYQAVVTGKRVFGFAGIMFVDYVGIALVITVITMIFYERRRLLFLGFFLILFVALIFTQTRNAWISSSLTLMLIGLQFIINSATFGFNRKKVIIYSILIVLLLVASIPLLQTLNPAVFKRLAAPRVTNSEDIANNFAAINSLASRFFIWLTAYNAFLAHPFIGIGFYGFPFLSKQYATIDPILYEVFVKKLSPHLTFLALLTETGILGFAGFMVFLTSTIRQAKKMMKQSLTKQSRYFSTVIFWLLIYTLFSMLMTDAWLALHGIALWGIMLSWLVANKRISSQENN